MYPVLGRRLVTLLLSPAVLQYLYPTVQQLLANGFVMSVVALVAALAQGTFSQCCTHVMVTEGVRLRSEIQVSRMGSAGGG